MDRAAKLAAEARCLLDDEAAFLGVISADANRIITRGALAELAERLGYSNELEISSAIDQALKDAGTTP